VMVDLLSPEKRSKNMGRIKSKDTKPEFVVRQLLFRLGYRFRLHPTDLPGKPDIVFIGRRKAIFVHGCFWHQHSECREGRMPGSRAHYWVPKLEGNVRRDRRHTLALVQLGWNVLVVWECETQSLEKLEHDMINFLGPAKARTSKAENVNRVRRPADGNTR
jgi:DNA mismatch endonuclease (patch repair protein)